MNERSWPFYKVAGLSLLAFGIPGALLALYPDYSPLAFLLSLVFVVAGVFVSARAVRVKDRWGQVAFLNVWLLLLLAIAVRMWTAAVFDPLTWTLILGSAYLLAWGLPILAPRLSSLLGREQIAPQTRGGRGCMVLALALLPAAGGIGAVIGVFGQRSGMPTNNAALMIGAGLSIAVLAFAQAMAHQLWEKRSDMADG